MALANSVNNYSAPVYYRNFFSSGMEKEELLSLLAEDSERLMHRGVYFTLHHDEFGIPNCDAQVMYIYANNFTPYHDHDYYEINYVFSGELLEYIDGRPFVLQRGDLLIMAPNVRHVSIPYKKATSYNVLLTEKLVKNTVLQLGKCDENNYLSELVKSSGFFIFHKVHTDAEPLIGDMRDLVRRFKKINKFRVPLLECMGQELLIRLCLYSYDVYVREENVLRENLTEEMLAKRIFAYITENLSTVSLEQISKYFGYSKRQIERLVEKYSGKNYAKYICGKRRHYSGQLIAYTDLSIAQVASMLGFSSPEYFCRWFKYYIGKTPSEYRKSSRQLEAGEGRQIVHKVPRLKEMTSNGEMWNPEVEISSMDLPDFEEE